MSEDKIEATPERSDEAVAEMYEALLAYVKRIETGPKLTQNNYGAYMGLFGALDTRENQRGMAHALIKVGANERGGP